ncbi:MAG: putative amidohydrolase YtcJ [Alteromonadaceae bacterium]|jgi:predicted amidohydrolase YtcJ
MKIKILVAVLFLSLSSTFVLAQTTLIKNIQGYTLNNKQLQQFSAIQFTDDKIDRILTLDDAIDEQKDWHVIDGKGATLLPGLIDAHGHVLSYGESLLQVDLVKSKSEHKAVMRAVSFAAKNPQSLWIKGRGWNQVEWPNNSFPTAKSLDQYFPNKPVFLARVDGHAVWVNSKAMALANINKQTKSPAGGEIIRDNKGQPTGVFIDNAMSLIYKNIPALTLKQKKNMLVKSMNSLASFGLTSVHDAGIDNEDLQAYQELRNEGNMPIRINAMLYLPSKNWQTTLSQGTFQSPDNMLNFNSVKIQADGALGSRGAALIKEYSDHPGHQGLLLHDKKELIEYIDTAMQAGFQVNTHAIGDNANKVVLDVYQASIQETKTKTLRHRVEHAQILRLEDIPRFNELGVIASMQAIHATSDKNMALDRIGNKRILGAYAWRKLLNENAIIAAGSDFPVESPNPFLGLHAAITRQDIKNQPHNGWYPKEKMTHIEAFRSFTSHAAYAGHQEDIIGSLLPGKKADFILIDSNIFTMPVTSIWQTKVLKTWVNGTLVFSR